MTPPCFKPKCDYCPYRVQCANATPQYFGPYYTRGYQYTSSTGTGSSSISTQGVRLEPEG